MHVGGRIHNTAGTSRTGDGVHCPHSLEHFGKHKSVLLVLGIEARVFVSAARSLITILSELHRLPKRLENVWEWNRPL
jgi:hypothetical protein